MPKEIDWIDRLFIAFLTITAIAVISMLSILAMFVYLGCAN